MTCCHAMFVSALTSQFWSNGVYSEASHGQGTPGRGQSCFRSLGWSLYVKKCLPKFQHYTKYKGSLLFQQQNNYKSFEILCFCLILDTQCNTCVCVLDRPIKSINHEPFFLILQALIYLITLPNIGIVKLKSRVSRRNEKIM